jgi:hypothetical protein
VSPTVRSEEVVESRHRESEESRVDTVAYLAV